MTTYLRYLAAIAEARTAADLAVVVDDLADAALTAAESEAVAVHVERRARMLQEGTQQPPGGAILPRAVQHPAQGKVWSLPADVTSLPAKKRPVYYCPDHPELAGELIDVWEVGSAGDRKLGTEMICPTCLRLIGSTEANPKEVPR
jgi:hypothetical protein